MPDRKDRPPHRQPEGVSIHVRLDAESEAILNRYCKQEGEQDGSCPAGIKRLKSDLKEE